MLPATHGKAAVDRPPCGLVEGDIDGHDPEAQKTSKRDKLLLYLRTGYEAHRAAGCPLPGRTASILPAGGSAPLLFPFASLNLRFAMARRIPQLRPGLRRMRRETPPIARQRSLTRSGHASRKRRAE